MQDTHWDDCYPKYENVNSKINRLTGPKPDIFYGYPVYRPNEDFSSGSPPQYWLDRFSYKYLREVCEEFSDLRATPTKGLKGKNSGGDVGEHHLVCYPWAVVEVKHGQVDNSDTTFCYRQAANATAAALVIQESLWKVSHNSLGRRIPSDLPPIVAFTCIGPKVRVWLTFKDRKSLNRQRRVSHFIPDAMPSVTDECGVEYDMHLFDEPYHALGSILYLYHR